MKLRRLALLGIIVACSPKFGPPLRPSRAGAIVSYDGGTETPAQKAHMSSIAVLRERAIGPYVAIAEQGGMAAYVAGAAPGSARRDVVVVPLGKTGAPDVQARAIAQTAPDTSTLVIRRVAPDYILAWTALTDRGEALNVIGVDDKGDPSAGPAVEVVRTPDHIVWVEVVPTARGAVCVWAEEPPTGSADVLAEALDSTGKLHGVPSRIIRNASAWQAVGTKDGVALAIVQGGTLSLAHLDGEGRMVGEPLPVSKTVGADMDMVRAGSNMLFAWTDRTRIDPQLVLAGVDAQRKVIAPHDAAPSEGSSSLVALASGDEGALVVWEPAHKRERIVRRVQLGVVTDPAVLTSKTAIDLAGGAAIEARGVGGGWALLGSGRPCALDGSGCGAPAPLFVRFDASLTVVQSEALVNGPAISLAWGMDCDAGRCETLAAGPDTPTTVYAIDLSQRASTHASPIAPAVPEDAPRLASTTTLISGTQVTDVASVGVGDATLVASVVGSASPDKGHEDQLSLRVTTLAKDKPPVTTTLASSVLSTGGVAMAPGLAPTEAAVAYVAKEGSGGRVHVARVDEHGARKSDRALAGGGRGEASDVSIVRVPDGYVVAWVDTRDGNGEVYVCKLTGDNPGPEVRVTNAPGDATDTTLAVSGSSVLLAWADPRESPHDGFADIYTVALSARDARPLGKDWRVLSTAAHSRSPVLARTSKGVALAWIEEAPAGSASDEAKGAMFAMLDDRGRPVRDPMKLRMTDAGTVTAVILADDPQARLLHAVTARLSQDELWLDAVRIPLDAGGSVESYPLFVLDGPSSMDEALALEGQELIYSDDSGEARVKRAVVVWKK